tara:strand:+ start:2354 stop:2926 length:573 start_codon:yes stop_codon:yes gene_type:complete
MNIFAIEKFDDGSIDWVGSANSHDILRANKMYIESTQMLATTCNLLGFPTRYKNAHINHPSTKWARESFSNFTTLFRFAKNLKTVYSQNSGKLHHGCDDVIAKIDYYMNVPIKGTKIFPNCFAKDEPTRLPLCMPIEYQTNDIVDSYRNFFANKDIIRYYEGSVPSWVYDYRTNPIPITTVPKAPHTNTQ